MPDRGHSENRVLLPTGASRGIGYTAVNMFLVVAMAVAAVAPAHASDFPRSDYVDVTARKKLPAPIKQGPLAAVDRYVATMPFLDRRKIAVEVLLDRDGRRVFRINHVCTSAEACGDDSVAATREALDLRKDKAGRWTIAWVGIQVRCHKGRGHQTWSKAGCL